MSVNILKTITDIIVKNYNPNENNSINWYGRKYGIGDTYILKRNGNNNVKIYYDSKEFEQMIQELDLSNDDKTIIIIKYLVNKQCNTLLKKIYNVSKFSVNEIKPSLTNIQYLLFITIINYKDETLQFKDYLQKMNNNTKMYDSRYNNLEFCNTVSKMLLDDILLLNNIETQIPSLSYIILKSVNCYAILNYLLIKPILISEINYLRLILSLYINIPYTKNKECENIIIQLVRKHISYESIISGYKINGDIKFLFEILKEDRFEKYRDIDFIFGILGINKSLLSLYYYNNNREYCIPNHITSTIDFSKIYNNYRARYFMIDNSKYIRYDKTSLLHYINKNPSFNINDNYQIIINNPWLLKELIMIKKSFKFNEIKIIMKFLPLLKQKDIENTIEQLLFKIRLPISTYVILKTILNVS